MAHSQEATPPGPLFLPPTRFSVMPMERSAALRYNVRLDRPLRTDYRMTILQVFFLGASF